MKGVRIRQVDWETARASLLAIWSALAGSELLAADRVVPHGIELADGELDLLLRWLR